MTDEEPRLSPLQVFGLALAAMLTLFAIALIAGWKADAKAGTYPDWIAAFATLAGFAAAIVAAWYAHSALKVEQERDRHRDDAERRAQAARVGAWGDIATMAHVTTYGRDYPDTGGPVTPDVVGPTLPDVLVATVRNTSELPVHDFWLQVYLQSPKSSTWDLVADYEVGRVLPFDSGELEHAVDLLAKVGTPSGGRINDPDGPLFKLLVEEFDRRGMKPGLNAGATYGWSFRDNNNVDWFCVPEQGMAEGPRPVVRPVG